MGVVDISKWLEVVKMLMPIAILTVPGADKLAPLSPVLITAIGNAQKSMKPGAEKKQIVLTSVADAINIANAAAGKTIIDPTQAVATAGHVVDAVVDSSNRMHDVGQAAAAGSDSSKDDPANQTTYHQ